MRKQLTSLIALFCVLYSCQDTKLDKLCLNEIIKIIQENSYGVIDIENNRVISSEYRNTNNSEKIDITSYFDRNQLIEQDTISRYFEDFSLENEFKKRYPNGLTIVSEILFFNETNTLYFEITNKGVSYISVDGYEYKIEGTNCTLIKSFNIVQS